MAKKNATKNEVSVENVEESAIDDTNTDGDLGDGLGSLDFNVEDEYKPDPLTPKGNYHGVVTKVSFTPAQACIVWSVCLHDNGGVMNDGETPIDGSYVYYRNWLPKPGDENEMTKSGKNNKRQSKINMLKDFSEELGLDMSNPTVIATALAEAAWIGLEVDVDVSINEYNGRFSNQIDRMHKSKMF